jgi:hypothetical protein
MSNTGPCLSTQYCNYWCSNLPRIQTGPGIVSIREWTTETGWNNGLDDRSYFLVTTKVSSTHDEWWWSRKKIVMSKNDDDSQRVWAIIFIVETAMFRVSWHGRTDWICIFLGSYPDADVTSILRKHHRNDSYNNGTRGNPMELEQ